MLISLFGLLVPEYLGISKPCCEKSDIKTWKICKKSDIKMAIFCKKSEIGAKFTIPSLNFQLTWSSLVELSIFNFQLSICSVVAAGGIDVVAY